MGSNHCIYKNDETLISMTPNSISLLDELKKESKKIKEKGHATDIEKFMTGIHRVAAIAIFN